MQKALRFLKELKSNNNKEWFDKHKPVYLESRLEFETFVNKLIKGLLKFDKKISTDLEAKDYVFRIYKDVRFSKDKTPYKHFMGASINPGGKKSMEAGYYFHLEPGGSFMAGGVYMPETETLNAIRQEIDYNPKPLMAIIKSAPFKKYFKGLDEEDKLKTTPKGFSKDHPNIELLRNRHFLVSHYYSDKQVSEPDFPNEVISGFKAMYPLMKYLREASGTSE